MTAVEIIVSVAGAILIGGYITTLYLIATVGTDKKKSCKKKLRKKLS